MQALDHVRENPREAFAAGNVVDPGFDLSGSAGSGAGLLNGDLGRLPARLVADFEGGFGTDLTSLVNRTDLAALDRSASSSLLGTNTNQDQPSLQEPFPLTPGGGAEGGAKGTGGAAGWGGRDVTSEDGLSAKTLWLCIHLPWTWFGRSLCKNRAHQTAAHDVGGSYLFYHMARPGLVFVRRFWRAEWQRRRLAI